MGCWHGTCGISQMSIVSSETVKVVIIQNQYQPGTASGFCYSNGHAMLSSFILEGTYNDYGSVNNLKDNLALKLFEKYFKECFENGTINVYPDEYYDREMKIINGDYSNIKGEQLLELLERDRVTHKVETWENDKLVTKESLLGIMFIHDDIFNNCLKHLEDKSIIKSDCDIAVKELFNTPEEDKFRFKTWDFDINKSGKWRNSVSILGDSSSVNYKIFSKYYRDILSEYRNNEELSDTMKDTIILIKIMEQLRKPFMGQAGKGGQDFNIDMYNGLINGMNQVILNYETQGQYDEE